jgi:hypothetical protein
VYFFHDASGTLLYIGQSVDLRARVGSYRHVSPERHPKRTLRLVHRIARIEWRECGSPAEAVELERVLLLEKRPPFNRAGTWPGYPWWLSVSADEHHVETRLARHASGDACCVGPLPPAYRHVHGSLMRCLYRLLHRDEHVAMYPHGLLQHPGPLHLRWRAHDAARVAASVAAFARRENDGLLVELLAILEGALPLELEFWTAELETLGKFLNKPRPAPVVSLPPPPLIAALPLFPDWC